MKHALRNLIAFVFLLGIFWFVYRDIDNLWNPRFQLEVGGLIVIFAVFWVVVPWLVVLARIARRVRQNERGYRDWKSKGAVVKVRTGRNSRLELEPGESERFHEKGTLYIEPGNGFDEISVPCRIGDVAFPKEKRDWRKIQRVHFYLTDRRVMFIGKEMDYRKGLGELRFHRAAPGGLVLEIGRSRFCFTVSNPLIADDIISGTVSAK